MTGMLQKYVRTRNSDNNSTDISRPGIQAIVDQSTELSVGLSTVNTGNSHLYKCVLWTDAQASNKPQIE